MSPIYLEKDTLVVRDGESFIVFSPFSQNIARVWVNPREDAVLYGQLKATGFFQEPPQHTKQQQEWNGFTSLALFLTRGCNLGCRYCYAKAKPYAPGMSMPADFALNSVDWFIHQLKKDVIRLTFHGGGEPTLEQETIRTVFDHVEICKGEKKAKYLITSNGTTPHKFLDWMMERGFGINFSVDGPPDIQNRNRPFADGSPSSFVVEDNIRYIVGRGYPLSVRMTYSAGDDITRTLEYFSSLGIKGVHLEPLFPYGREYNMDSTEISRLSEPKISELLNGFLTAINVAKRLGIKLYNGHLAHFMRGTAYFCGAASGKVMMVTHDGFLSSCIEVTDGKEAVADHFIIGKWNDGAGEFIVEEKKIATMLTRHPDGVLPACKDCFAKFTCAGGCAIKALHRTDNFFSKDNSYCAFTRAIVPEMVKRIASESNI